MLRNLAAALLVPALLAPRGALAQVPTPAATPPAQPAIDEQAFDRGLDLYERGEYALAAQELAKILYPPPKGFDPDKKRRAHLYRGISLFLLSDRDGADREFWQVLLSDPEFKPDPLFTPPPVIAAFEKMRKDNASELKKIPRLPKRIIDPERDPLGIPKVNQPDSGDFWQSIAPFGWAQFKNGQPGKGYAFLSAEVVLLSINLTTYTTLESLQKDGSRFDNVENARLLKTANNATFFLLVGTLLYGSADGVWTATNKRTKPGAPVITPGPGTAGIQMTWQF